MDELAQLREAAKEMLKFGQHDGPCDNVDENGSKYTYGACSHHLAAADRRAANLRALLDKG